MLETYEGQKIKDLGLISFMPSQFAYDNKYIVNIIGIYRSEEIVKEYYENQHYSVIRLEPPYYTGEDNKNIIKSRLGNIDYNDIFCAGIPDLFVYDKDTFFFIEVKYGDDPTGKQILWMLKNKIYPSYILRISTNL